MEYPQMQTGKTVRGGTKSCTECRRRKIRCIRTSEDAPTCRTCEKRGSTCLAQIYCKSQPLKPQKLPSRYRISQLESKFTTLNRIVDDLQSKLGYQPSETPDTIGRSSADIDDSGDDSSVVDVPIAERPVHLRSLFQNEWLSTDTHQQAEALQDRNAKASAHLLDVAKQALRKLIPSKDEFSEFARSSFFSGWLALLHDLLPQPFAIDSPQEFLESFNDMNTPDVDAMSLATWLVTVAITGQQNQRTSAFSQAVSDTVESTILSHDRLTGTVQGLGIAVHYTRLQLSLGNFQKAWIRMRHFTAIAELMGLPREFQAIELNKINGTRHDETQLQKAQLWESICSVDRLFAMMINLPSGTCRYQPSIPSELTIDGVVQTHIYFSRLANITIKVQDLDDMCAARTSKDEMYASALRIDGELNELASQTPESWWTMEEYPIRPFHFLRFLHTCIVMRTHLPFTMRQDPKGERLYSRVSCMNACESVAKHYQFLRRRFPSGIFLCRILDLQVFTAIIVLLLTSQNSPSMDQSNSRTNKRHVASLVEQVTNLMGDNSSNNDVSNFAQHGVATIRSLQTLMQRDENRTHVQELSIKVPLLGNVRVRRNVSPSQQTKASNPPYFQPLQETASWGPNEQIIQSPYGHPGLSNNNIAELVPQTQGEWQWDPLSWSIDNYNENFFQDPFMAGNHDQFNMWIEN